MSEKNPSCPQTGLQSSPSICRWGQLFDSLSREQCCLQMLRFTSDSLGNDVCCRTHSASGISNYWILLFWLAIICFSSSDEIKHKQISECGLPCLFLCLLGSVWNATHFVGNLYYKQESRTVYANITFDTLQDCFTSKQWCNRTIVTAKLCIVEIILSLYYHMCLMHYNA